MNLNYAIFRSQPIMTINDLAGTGSHNKREKQSYKSNPDIKKELSSETGLRGFIKKLFLLLIVSMGVLLDTLTNASGVIRNFIIFYYLANEGLSILENLGETGVKFPKKLREMLKQLEKEE